MLFGPGLVRAVVGASCCGVLLCVVLSLMAFWGVVVLLRCVVVSCCAVLCAVVLRSPVVPWCWGVRVFSFAAGVPFFFKNYFSVFKKK